jgi:hypothetical protein
MGQLQMVFQPFCEVLIVLSISHTQQHNTKTHGHNANSKKMGAGSDFSVYVISKTGRDHKKDR